MFYFVQFEPLVITAHKKRGDACREALSRLGQPGDDLTKTPVEDTEALPGFGETFAVMNLTAMFQYIGDVAWSENNSQAKEIARLCKEATDAYYR